jgi:enterochelin esterase-like enzyme
MRAIITAMRGALYLAVLSGMRLSLRAAAPAAPAPPATVPQLVIVAPVDALTTPPTPDKKGNFKIAPPYSNASELTVKEGVPAGTLTQFTMSSADSKMYPGLRGPYQRQVWAYVPSQYVAGTAAPFLVAQDAMQRQTVPHILDNMINEKRVPVLVAIFISNGGGDGQGSERGLEYDTVSGKYAEFVEAEVLPLVEKNAKVTLTKDPDGRATFGGSSGAAAAFTMAWYHPDLYHRVISYSGTFVNQQSPLNPETPHGAWEYHEHLIAAADKKPLRVWLEVGSRDNRATDPESTYHNWALANNRMADVLKAKGYEYQYTYAENAGHVDGKVVAQTLPEALEWVWRGYTAK